MGALWLVSRMNPAPAGGSFIGDWRAPFALYAGGLLALAASIKVLPALLAGALVKKLS